jgi:hypothetical protein
MIIKIGIKKIFLDDKIDFDETRSESIEKRF